MCENIFPRSCRLNVWYLNIIWTWIKIKYSEVKLNEVEESKRKLLLLLLFARSIALHQIFLNVLNCSNDWIVIAIEISIEFDHWFRLKAHSNCSNLNLEGFYSELFESLLSEFKSLSYCFGLSRSRYIQKQKRKKKKKTISSFRFWHA